MRPVQSLSRRQLRRWRFEPAIEPVVGTEPKPADLFSTTVEIAVDSHVVGVADRRGWCAVIRLPEKFVFVEARHRVERSDVYSVAESFERFVVRSAERFAAPIANIFSTARQCVHRSVIGTTMAALEAVSSAHPGATVVDPARVALDRAEPEVSDPDGVGGGAPRLLGVARDANEPRLIGVHRDLVAHGPTVRHRVDTDRDDTRDPAVARASPQAALPAHAGLPRHISARNAPGFSAYPMTNRRACDGS
jgi:hypothetical protein